MIKVIFDNSGDELAFKSVNRPVAEYYIDSLNKVGLNEFSLTQPSSIPVALTNLRNSIGTVNEFLYDITGTRVPEFDIDGFLTHRNLNKMHSDWVESQTVRIDVKSLRNSDNPRTVTYANALFDKLPDDNMTPTLGEVVSKLGFMKTYSKINMDVHRLASGPYRYATREWVEFPNGFDKSCVTNDKYNLTMPFNHLGRSLYNKFVYFDSELEFPDENTFDELLGIVEINLHRKETANYSVEFLEWCKRMNRAPTGEFLNLGYIKDLEENLNSYRLLLYRNLTQNNKFSLHL